MIGNKLLSIYECQFCLPDDFDGTLGDALMLLAKTRLESEAKNNIKAGIVDQPCYYNLVNDCYKALLNDNETKCAIKCSLCELSNDKIENMKNILYKPMTSCIQCEHHDYYFPTDDWFDEEHVCICKITDRKSPDNEIGYGSSKDDFPIPNWCPLLAK